MKKLLLLALGLAGAGRVAAQDTEKVRFRLAVAPQLQAAVVLADGNYAYFSFDGRRSTNYQPGRPSTLGLDYYNVTAGYEHAWNPTWSWGATLRFAQEPATYLSRGALVPGLLLRHRAILGGITLGQRLGVEYALGSDGANPSPFPTALVYSRTLLRLRLDAEKRIQLGSQPDGFALRPRLSFEPALFVRLQKADSDPDKRTVDFTSLRAEIGLEPGARVSITPWVGVQTTYSRILIQTDKNGVPTSNGKLNAATPVLGLDLRYTFRAAQPAADWQQLPTQN